MTGQECAWCGSPGVCEVEVQPAQYRTVSRVDAVSGERVADRRLVRLAIRVAACEEHRGVAVGQPRAVPSPRERCALGVQQLGLFASAEQERMRNAIYGEAGP